MTRSRASATGPPGGAAALARLRARLLRWYRRHARALPWRETDDPYAIWVSEVMLQQTRVSAVLPYYRRFLERFPTVADLAAADEDQVLGAWSGLGYYRRARALRESARALVQRFDGRLPREPRSLRELPGVGRYTAGAIASIAFGVAEPVLDGNVRRVLSRLFAVRETGRTARGDERLWRIAARLVRGPDPGGLNQALMELGALVCAQRAPRCRECPLRRDCRALAAGAPESYPASRPRRATQTVRVAAAWIVRGDRVLLVGGGPGSPLRGRWDVPALELSQRARAVAALRRRLRDAHGIEAELAPPVARLRHGILHRRLRVEVLPGWIARGRGRASDELLWAPLERLGETAVSGATLKIARAVLHDSPAAVAPAPPPAGRRRVGRRNQPPST